MMKKTKHSPLYWINWLAHPRVLFYTLPYFMLLLMAGTLAQKYIGLHLATDHIFNAFIVWIGYLPLPGGASILTVLFLNLAAHFITQGRWEIKKIGTYLTHLGVIILLVGGFVTLMSKEEGFIILRHGQPAAAIYDYHARDFIIEKNDQVIFKTDIRTLAQGSMINVDNLSIKIDTIYANSTIDAQEKIKELPAKKDDETNQAGLAFSVADKKLATTEFSGEHPSYKKYRFILRRVSRPLPFKLALKELNQDLYPGDQSAKDYETKLDVIEKDHNWPSRIAMNEPLRYRGYTFYQSSVLTLPNAETASVLNVVKNAGWIFPYAATALIIFGLLIHGWMRRHAKK